VPRKRAGLPIVSALLLLVLVLTACTTIAPSAAPGSAGQTAATSASPTYLPPLPTDQQITIKFENYNLASAGRGRDATLKMIADFEAAHPNVHVETKATGSEELFPSIQAQMVAGDPPDIAQLVLREWDLNVEFLQPQDLKQLVPPDELAAHLGGQYPLHPRAAALTERNGKLQGLPYVFSTPTLFYNADLFKQAGLDPDKPPKTWEEAKQAGLQIKQKLPGNEGVFIQCIELDWCTQGLIRSNDGRVMSEDRTKIMFGEPASVDVLTFWQGMINAGAHPKFSEKEAVDAFQAGKLGMLLTTSAYQSSLLRAADGKFTVRATGQPSFGDKPAIPVNSGSGLAILSQDPIKQRAAWELMKSLTSEQAFTIITTDIGYLPLRTGIVDDDRYLKNWPNLPLIRANLEQMDRLEPSYSYPGQNALQIRKLFLTAVQEVLLQNKDPKTTMGDAQARAQDLMPKP
jgi:multiple sugar transport system substrate-binding protein